MVTARLVLHELMCSAAQAAETSGQESEAAELFSEPAKGTVGGQPAVGRRSQRSMQELLDQYFGRDEELGEDDLFLKRFMSQRVGLHSYSQGALQCVYELQGCTSIRIVNKLAQTCRGLKMTTAADQQQSGV